MTKGHDDVRIFTEGNIHKQLQTAPFTQGFYTLTFYTENGKPAAHRTETISEFYLYPSGGTLRDSTFNLVFYDSQFDTYRGFKPPHLERKLKVKSEKFDQKWFLSKKHLSKIGNRILAHFNF